MNTNLRGKGKKKNLISQPQGQWKKVHSLKRTAASSRSPSASIRCTYLVLEMSLTILRGSVIGLVYSDPEALVASPSSDHVRPRAVKGHLGLGAALVGLWHRRLEALQRAGLPQAQGWTQDSIGRRLWDKTERRQWGGADGEGRGGRVLNAEGEREGRGK